MNVVLLFSNSLICLGWFVFVVIYIFHIFNNFMTIASRRPPWISLKFGGGLHTSRMCVFALSRPAVPESWGNITWKPMVNLTWLWITSKISNIACKRYMHLSKNSKLGKIHAYNHIGSPNEVVKQLTNMIPKNIPRVDVSQNLAHNFHSYQLMDASVNVQVETQITKGLILNANKSKSISPHGCGSLAVPL